MDEATSSVDGQTDELIQRIIDEEMRHCTVVTISHRLTAVMNYDRVDMVLDAGEIEKDSPNVCWTMNSVISINYIMVYLEFDFNLPYSRKLRHGSLVIYSKKQGGGLSSEDLALRL